MKNFNSYLPRVLTILAPSIILRALAMDILLPCVPTIAEEFAVSFSKSQWILSVYFISAGLGQLFVGPLADEYGRRKVLIASTILILFSSFGCALSVNIWWLILMRSLQGFGACGTTIVSMAIIRDLYSEPKLSKVYSYVNAIIGLAPLLAPILGGILLVQVGWRSTFYFVVLFSILAVVVDWLYVSETNPKLSKNKDSIDIPIIKSYLKLLKDPEYLYYCCCNVMGMSTMFMFFSMSSILLIRILKIDPQTFGYYFASVSIMYVIGTILSPQVQTKFKANGTILIGSILMLISGIIMYTIDYLHGLSALGVVVPNMLATFGVGLLFGPCMGGVVKNYQHIAGIASAAYGAIFLTGSSLIIAAIMHFEITDARLMAISLTVMGLLSIFAIRQIQKNY